jgi:SAM-dependent methyltransferase
MVSQVHQVPAWLVHALVWLERYIAPNSAPNSSTRPPGREATRLRRPGQLQPIEFGIGSKGLWGFSSQSRHASWVGLQMTDGQHHYQALVAEYWDLLRGDTSNWASRPYFLGLIRESGEPALDVACGTGRLLLDYLQEGVDIDGVDISPEMINHARENARRAGLSPNLYVQAMQALELPRTYRTIIVPSSSFLHLTSRLDADLALRRFLHHLEPGGLLAMSMRIMDASEIEIDWDLEAEAVRPGDGATVRRWFRCRYDPHKRLQHTEDRYEVVLDGQIVQSESYISSPFLTWYSLAQALDLLRSNGFVDVRAHSDFKFEPASDQDTSYIVLGNRP